MINYQHSELASGRWASMSLAEQMLNIGSEVSRANRWQSKGNMEQCHRAADIYQTDPVTLQKYFDVFYH